MIIIKDAAIWCQYHVTAQVFTKQLDWVSDNGADPIYSLHATPECQLT